jgi:AcrR family transcriptional regulator
MARTPKVVEDRREQILDAAMRIFAQKGFIRATNKDIAREAGITPGLIYHYFESKEAVLKAVIESRSPLKILRTLPQEMLALPPEMLLPFLLRQVFTIVESEDFVRLLRILLPEAIHHPEGTFLSTEVFQRVLSFLESYFRARMEEGEFRQGDALLTAQVLVGSMMGFILRRQILSDPVALALTQEQIIAAIVDHVLYGLKPR